MPPPPGGQSPGHLTFLKKFGQIPQRVGSLDGQMPHRLALQKASNPPSTNDYLKEFPLRQTFYSDVNVFGCFGGAES